MLAPAKSGPAYCNEYVYVDQNSRSSVRRRYPGSRLCRGVSRSLPMPLLPALHNATVTQHFNAMLESETVFILYAYSFVRQVSDC